MSTTLEIEQQVKIVEAWEQSPLIRHYSFFDTKLWSKQEEVLWALRNYDRVAVKSANTVGKTFIAADAVLDFLAIHFPSKVITTAPTWTQVESILWKEIGRAVNTSKIPFQASLNNAELKLSDDWFAMGISTNEVNRFQGFHSPNLLVVIDEAMGVAPEIWEAIESLHPSKILAIGNPLEPNGDFYKCFQSNLWHKITISAEECVEWQKVNGRIPGLVTEKWIKEREEDWGKGSSLFYGHVLGEFPEDSPDMMIQRRWVDDARKRDLEEIEEESDRLIAADIATKHGDNETVIGYRYGNTIKSLRGYQKIPTTESIDRIALAYATNKAHTTTIDSDGIGEGVSDGLSERHIPVIEFHGGYAQKAIDQTKFRNLRSQFYWIVSKKFEKGLYSLKHLDDKSFEILKNQLCSIRAKRPDALGRLQIETKEDMLTRGVRSPDYADCFMMMEYSSWMQRMSDIKPMSYR